jgi:tRNA dimethylallyltransferase
VTDSRRISQLAITGPTAGGKSDFAMRLARCLRDRRKIPVEIVSCDSVQVYRGFDIGSAKPTREEMAEFPHHMIDVVTWRDDFDAGRYAEITRDILNQIKSRGALPILVGGTGLYLRALFGQGFDDNLPKDDQLRRELDSVPTPELFAELMAVDPGRASQLHPNDRVRILRAVELCRLTGGPVSPQMVGPGGVASQMTPERAATLLVFLNPDRALLHERIATRCKSMLAAGLVEEVRGLMADGCLATAKPMQAIGYRETCAALRNAGIDQDALAAQITIATRQYAKRQITWFKGSGPDHMITDLDALDAHESAIAGLCALEYDLR